VEKTFQDLNVQNINGLNLYFRRVSVGFGSLGARISMDPEE
jgi:hypothetical protein